MTIAPAAATIGASCFDVAPPAREQRDVEAGEVGGGGVLDRDLACPSS